MKKHERLEITIKYNDFKQTISGSPEDVTREYFNVLGKVIPAIDVMSGLTVSPNLADMATKLRGATHLYKDRVFILKKNPMLEDAILLALVSKYIGFGLGLTSNDSMSLQELLDSTGKTKKSTVRILDKLKSTNAVEQLLEGRYRILDWKAYDYVLRKLPDKKSIKLTDFAKKDSELYEYQPPAFTAGYEGQEPGQFLKSLSNEGINILVDVRKDAYSKQDMSYSEGALSRIAADVRIKYIHLPELGVDYDIRQELKSTHDYETYFKRYSEYLEKNLDLVAFVAQLAKNNVICLMCYEKDFKRCHRSILANKLEELGITFLHK
ncbi:MAG: DUF488 family protein [Candidatus Hodarchaeota archaeon]